MSNRAILIGYGNLPVAVVPTIEYGIDKVKEWNNESTFNHQYQFSNQKGESLVTQVCPDNRIIHWWYRDIKVYSE